MVKIFVSLTIPITTAYLPRTKVVDVIAARDVVVFSTIVFPAKASVVSQQELP